MKYDLITDGSALAYANCGSWSFLLKGHNHEKARCGARWQMGSNQMELWAILEGLASLSKASQVTVYTDSHYVINGVKKSKHVGLLLWDELYLWLQMHNVTFVKVGKAHPFNGLHNQAHHLAREAVFDAVHKKRPDDVQQREILSADPVPSRYKGLNAGDLRKPRRRDGLWNLPLDEDSGGD